MPKSSLYLPYYRDMDSKHIDLVQILGSCSRKNYYFLLRDTVTNDMDILKLFFDDFLFSINYSLDNKISTILVDNINDLSTFFSEKNEFFFESDAENAIKLLEELLDKDNIVLTNTVMRKVPFYHTYTDGSVIYDKNINYGHVFLTIWHDSKYFYYVEHYDAINKNNYIPFDGNINVGKIEKKDLIVPFNLFARFNTMKPAFNKLENIDECFINTYDNIIRNYYEKEGKNQIGGRKVVGRNVIIDLINICESRNIYLNDDLKYYNLSNGTSSFYDCLFNKLNDAIVLSCNRKIVFKMILEKNDFKNCENIKRLIELLDLNINKWSILGNIIKKQFLKCNYLLGPNYKKLLLDILQIEDNLYISLDTNRNYVMEILSI